MSYVEKILSVRAFVKENIFEKIFFFKNGRTSAPLYVLSHSQSNGDKNQKSSEGGARSRVDFFDIPTFDAEHFGQ